MIEFEGTYFDGITSSAHLVKVSVEGLLIKIREKDGPMAVDFLISECKISPALGRTGQSLILPGGARCDTDDLEAVAALERGLEVNLGSRIVHYLESSWRLAAGCLLGLVLCVWLFIAYGIPLLAERVALSVPVAVLETISLQTLEVLDGRFLGPSKLDRQRAAEIESIFDQLKNEKDNTFNYRLEFRDGRHLGPNALALPSGLILMTDQLVELAEEDRELAGVLIHEIEHVEKRHGARSILQNAGVFLIIATLVGDIASITSTAAALPTLLVESGYSRDFEKEADEAAGLYFRRKGWSSKPFQDILIRITEKMPEFPGGSLLSSHPLTSERLRYLQTLEKNGQDQPSLPGRD